MMQTAFRCSRLARLLPLMLGGLLFALPVGAVSTLSVNGTGAHCGNFGLVVSMDGSTAAWVETDHPANEPRYVVRFYMKLDYASPASNLEIFTAYQGPDGNTSTPVVIVTVDSSKNLHTQHRTDAGLSAVSAGHALSNGWHAIELDWQTGAGTGSLTTKIDDVTDAALGASSLTNGTRTVEFGRWGAVGGALTGTGYLDLDDFVTQRTGPIGLLPACGTNDSLTPEDLKFYPVAPCRAYFTGWPSETPGVGGTERVIDIRSALAQNECDTVIPADAKALAINFTASNPTSNGNFKVFPDGIPAPTATTMNFLQNVNRANNAFVLAGGGAGQVRLRVLPFTTTPAAQVGYIIDVAGYFKKP